MADGIDSFCNAFLPNLHGCDHVQEDRLQAQAAEAHVMKVAASWRGVAGIGSRDNARGFVEVGAQEADVRLCGAPSLASPEPVLVAEKLGATRYLKTSPSISRFPPNPKVRETIRLNSSAVAGCVGVAAVPSTVMLFSEPPKRAVT